MICYKCGNDYSKKELRCPHCNTLNRRLHRTITSNIITIVVLVAIGILLMFLSKDLNESEQHLVGRLYGGFITIVIIIVEANNLGKPL